MNFAAQDKKFDEAESHPRQSLEIRERVAELQNNILSGLILVFIVVFIFMGVSNGFFVALAIPISFLITFIAFSLLGITLNMIVLFALRKFRSSWIRAVWPSTVSP